MRFGHGLAFTIGVEAPASGVGMQVEQRLGAARERTTIHIRQLEAILHDCHLALRRSLHPKTCHRNVHSSFYRNASFRAWRLINKGAFTFIVEDNGIFKYISSYFIFQKTNHPVDTSIWKPLISELHVSGSISVNISKHHCSISPWHGDKLLRYCNNEHERTHKKLMILQVWGGGLWHIINVYLFII